MKDGNGSDHERSAVSPGLARAFLAHQLGSMVADIRSESLQAWLDEVRSQDGALSIVAEAVVNSITRIIHDPVIIARGQEFSLRRLDEQIGVLRSRNLSKEATRQAVGALADEFTRALIKPSFTFETATGRQKTDDAMRAFQAAVAEAASATICEEESDSSPRGAIFEVLRETAATVRICLENSEISWLERVRAAQPARARTTPSAITAICVEETEFDFAAGHGVVFAPGIKPVV